MLDKHTGDEAGGQETDEQERADRERERGYRDQEERLLRAGWAWRNDPAGDTILLDPEDLAALDAGEADEESPAE